MTTGTSLETTVFVSDAITKDEANEFFERVARVAEDQFEDDLEGITIGREGVIRIN